MPDPTGRNDTTGATTTEGETQTQWDGKDEHGWGPNAPGTGETKERVIEGDRKAFAAEHGTQAESRAPDGGFEVEENPLADSVGQSESRSGEDVMGEDGKEPGRFDKGTKGEADRPYGGSTPRDATGVGQTDDDGS